MDLAAGVVLAEQAISTTVEGAVVGGIALAKSTQPLKAHFTQFATTPNEEPTALLHVSQSTISVINNHAYVLGGQLSDGSVAGDEVHIFNLKPSSDSSYAYKYGHTAEVIQQKIYMYGGRDSTSIVKDAGIWLFDPESMKWSLAEGSRDSAAPTARTGHGSTVWNDSLIIHGGHSFDGSKLNDVWSFHTLEQKWSRLADIGTLSSIAAAVVDDHLHIVDHTDQGETIHHFLDLQTALSEWQKIVFPLSVPHPSPRTGAALLPVDLGMGRKYLVYVLGEESRSQVSQDDQSDTPYRSDIWAYQLEASSKTPAGLKDATNETIGLDSDRATWAEVNIQPDEEKSTVQGKSHPGPRAFSAATNLDSRSVILWGGKSAKGDVEGDGWIIKFEC